MEPFPVSIRNEFCRLSTLVLFLLTTRHAQAEDWPWLRGPAFDGSSTETDLVETWPDDGPPVLWFRDLGHGYSSFAVVDGRAYTQYQNVYGQFVICLDGATGETVWEHRYGLPYEAFGIYPGPRSTPTVAAGRVYFAGPSGLVGCLDVENGDELWSVNLTEKYDGRGTEFGYSSSPLLIDGLLLFPVGGPGASLVALDSWTGETVWSSGDERASYSTLRPITLDGESLIVGYLQNAVVVCEIESGREVWRESLSVGYDEHSAQPLYSEPVLMLSAPFRAGANAYQLAWDRDIDPPRIRSTSLWHNEQFSNDVISSILAGGAVWGFDLRDPQSKAHRPSRGTFRCLEFSSGNELWSTPELGQSSMIAVDGKLILFSDAGEVILIRQSSDEYEELTRASLFADEVCWTPPALSDGRLFLRTHERALCLFLGEESALQPEEQARSVPAAQVAATASTDWNLLLNGEREHPFMRPGQDELSLWYLAALAGGFLPAALLAGLWQVFKQDRYGPATCLGFLFVSGTVATPIFNGFTEEFVFTWPAALYAALQLTLLTIVWAERQENLKPARRRSRIAVLLLLASCLAYFLVLRSASLPHEWVFLFGLLPVFPLAVWTARRIDKRPGLTLTLLLSLITFSCYFWFCGGLQMARTAWGI